MNPRDFWTIQAMKLYGGSFVKKLADLCELADHRNMRTIKDSWPEYFEQYEKMGRDIQRKEEKPTA